MTSNFVITNAILKQTEVDDMAGQRIKKSSDNQDAQWQAVLNRDATQDGKFVFAVSSTGIYCRPSCPARRARRENVTFFRKLEEAEKAGYRACLRCRPKTASGTPQVEMVRAVCRYIEQHLDEAITPDHAWRRVSPKSVSPATNLQGHSRHFAACLYRLLPDEQSQTQSARRPLSNSCHV